MDGLAHLLEGAAAANVGDLVIDVSVGRLRLFFEQRRNRHDHTALAIAALRHVMLDPGLLYLVQRAVLGKAFDRGDLLAVGRRLTGTEQERIAMPSIWTVQAPHCAMPQPYLVPVKPIVSRNTQSSGVSGSTSTSCVCPLIFRAAIHNLRDQAM